MKKPIFKIKHSNESFHFGFVIPGQPYDGMGEGYTSKQMTQKGIESVKAHCADKSNYELLEARNGQLYFNLRAKNNEVIYTSTMCNSQAEREDKMMTLMQFGGEAEVIFVEDEQ